MILYNTEKEKCCHLVYDTMRFQRHYDMGKKVNYRIDMRWCIFMEDRDFPLKS